MSWVSDLKFSIMGFLDDIDAFLDCFPIVKGFITVLVVVFIVILVLKVIKSLPLL